MKPWQCGAYSIVCWAMATNVNAAQELLLEPKIQGLDTGRIVHATQIGDVYFFDVLDMADALSFNLNTNSGRVDFLGRAFSIADPAPSMHFVSDGRDYYSAEFYQQRLPIMLMVNPRDMQLDVFSDYTLPSLRNAQNTARRNNITNIAPYDSFDNYEFDRRLFSFPVVDLIYRRTQDFYSVGRNDSRHNGGNFYQANASMILAGMDTQVTIFGDDYMDHKLYDMGARIVVGRTLLDEPPNILNLRRWSAGDIVSDGNNMFFYGASGRGAMLSSFKDLVISADKTIDISGNMPSGWDAELYLNNQLIGFRQSGVGGRYEFKNVPVGYGLNDFRVVMYGPFGETRTEQRRYYSGTSPVHRGELGYNITVQEPNKYIVNTDNSISMPSDGWRTSSMFYYGLTDRLSLIGGVASTPHADGTGGDFIFSSMGAQMALNGVSMQYNANYNMTRNSLGHHFDIQGDVYIGTLFARYEYYGDTQSPISYYENQYLKNLFEGRLTGAIPWINVPYYVSYINRTLDDDSYYHEVHARISPNFMRYYNFTVENTWRRDVWGREDYTDALFQATYGRVRMNASLRYQTNPTSYLRDYGAFFEYRWDKNTYVQATWKHDRPSFYGDHGDIDTAGLGVGRLFRFGGITFTVTGDTDKNLSFGLTYNISFGRCADRASLFTNSENQMINYGTIYAMARDERGDAVPNVKLIVNGRESPSVTDADGVAVITNLAPYQKSTITVDDQDVSDLALVPQWMDKKIVLRPGAVRNIEIPFARRGGIEGQVAIVRPTNRYTVRLVDNNGATVATTHTDASGGFIIDGVKYGDYMLQVIDSKNTMVGQMEITIDHSFYPIKTPIPIIVK